MQGSHVARLVMGGAIIIGLTGCGRTLPNAAGVRQTPQPPAAAPAAPAASEAPAAPAPAMQLSFNLFGIHKTYSKVTAEIGQSSEGKPQTTIRAIDGPNTLTMVVDGTGVGEHPVKQVAIKDEKLGGQEHTFDASDPKLSGSVTFTEFNAPNGVVAGTFTAAYRGFPPISVSGGEVMAMAVPAGQGMATAARR
jgi:hypothetical protein